MASMLDSICGADAPREIEVLAVRPKTKYRLLVVDDDERILRFLRLKLMSEGYEVVTAMTGQGALTMAESHEPDVIILDMKLPGKNGLDVLKELKKVGAVPVIVISAGDECVEEAMRLGARSFLRKPFNPDELKDIVESILRGNPGKQRAIA
jgi:DNA-binding response OmpR family regulator